MFIETFTDITTQPVSMNTTLNSTVIFICEAIANDLSFRINGVPVNHELVQKNGFSDSISGCVNCSHRTGKLEAIAYDYNNNTEIKCRASNDSPSTVVFSEPALLLIQGG